MHAASPSIKRLYCVHFPLRNTREEKTLRYWRRGLVLPQNISRIAVCNFERYTWLLKVICEVSSSNGFSSKHGLLSLNCAFSHKQVCFSYPNDKCALVHPIIFLSCIRFCLWVCCKPQNSISDSTRWSPFEDAKWWKLLFFSRCTENNWHNRNKYSSHIQYSDLFL